MSNYFGYVSVDALMDFAHNHVNGMIDSNDIARFPKANVKDANEQQSLQEIFGIPFARLRELAEAEREGRVVVLNEIFKTPTGQYGFIYYDKQGLMTGDFRDTKAESEAARALAATEPKGDAT